MGMRRKSVELKPFKTLSKPQLNNSVYSFEILGWGVLRSLFFSLGMSGSGPTFTPGEAKMFVSPPDSPSGASQKTDFVPKTDKREVRGWQ